MRRIVIHIIFTLFLYNLAVSQENEIINQQVLWTKYHLHWKINNKWSMSNFGDERTFLSPKRRHMFLGSLSVTRKLKKNWSATLDFKYARFTLPHDPEVRIVVNRWELRPTQTISHSFKLSKKWKLSNRLMLEERFFRPFNEDGSLDKSRYDFGSWRLRHRIAVSWNFQPRWNLNISDEYMFHDGPSPPHAFDQNRFNVTAQYRINDFIGIEGGYLNWYQRRPDPNVFFSRHSWRTILHIYL